MKLDLRKIYRFEAVEHGAGTPLPTGGDVFYECMECNTVISSVPYTPAACDCGNLSGNKGATTIRDSAKVKPVRGRLK
ncbi:MAG: hypothetical protein HY066_12185 [Betaproteobacteria bacterium]|nr:hypothetical protein [Betaproteobacteria bacterium]